MEDDDLKSLKRAYRSGNPAPCLSKSFEDFVADHGLSADSPNAQLVGLLRDPDQVERESAARREQEDGIRGQRAERDEQKRRAAAEARIQAALQDPTCADSAAELRRRYGV